MQRPFLVSSAIRIAADVLPSLATRIAGRNAERVASQILDTALATVGMGQDATPEQVIAELRSNRDKREELRFRLEQIDAEQREQELKDLQDARAYQLESGGLRGNILLGFAGAGLVVCVFVVSRGGFTDNVASLGLITTVAGAFLKMISDAFAFEFGSSRGSKSKELQIAKFQTQLEEVGRANLSRGTPPDRETTVNMPVAVAEDDDDDGPSPPRRQSDDKPTEPRNFVRLLVEGQIDLT